MINSREAVIEFVQSIRDQKKIETMKMILKSQNIRDHCLFVLGINRGLRVSDLLKLIIADVLDERGKVKDRITIRKIFAYHANKSGTDITLLQKILNHHSPATTLRYIGITQEEMDDVYLTVNL